MSPPARVAWIETTNNHIRVYTIEVATREGGVDRNSRSRSRAARAAAAPPARVAWIETSSADLSKKPLR